VGRRRIFGAATRASVASLAIALALSLATSAVASARVYTGTIVNDGATTVSLTVEKRDGQRTVTEFSARNFMISCDDGVQARLDAEITGSTNIREGHFAVKAGNGAQVVALTGSLVGSTQATGTVRYSGLTKVIVGETSERLDCDSGRLQWKASR
jgi:hypothetical protein